MSSLPDSLVDAQNALRLAREQLDSGDPIASLKTIETHLYGGGKLLAGMQFVRALAYKNTGRDVQAFHAMEAELAIDPANEIARQHVEAVQMNFSKGSSKPSERPWTSGLGKAMLDHFELAAQRNTYRGVPLIKNCFDQALYPMLLFRNKPATIVEIGTFCGGSAIWFADLTRNFGFESHIYSSDPFAMPVLSDERVTFLRGNGRNLASVFSREFLAELPRPLMVIEDADHSNETTTAVLNFFHPIMRSGEYIVVEDGLSSPGVRNALVAFFGIHGDDYEVDPRYCDYFGNNVTWCMNGFLRRR